MGYNNNNNNNRRYGSNYNGGNGGNYSNGGYNQNYNRSKPQFKKSGVVYTPLKDQQKDCYIVNAWNASRSKGLITAKVAPYHKTFKGDKVDYVDGAGNKQYVKMICELTYTKSGHTRLIPCLMNVETHVIALQDIGMVITPNGHGKTKSGKVAKGYFGQFK